MVLPPSAIGLLRGQHTLPLLLPDDIVQRYRSAPGDFVTAYFILDGGRTSLIAESYAFLDETGLPTSAFAAVTGGVGRFRAAAGESRSLLRHKRYGMPEF